MTEETQITTRETTTKTGEPSLAAGIASDSSRNGDSHIFRISIRAWIALIFVGTVCYMSVFSVRQIEEPLYSLATLAVGFYFGQKAQKPS